MILFDDPVLRNKLKPLTLNRPVGKLRVGIETISEKWQRISEKNVSFLTEAYLEKKYAASAEDDLYVNASVLPTEELWQVFLSLNTDEVLKADETIIAMKSSSPLTFGFTTEKFNIVPFQQEITVLSKLPDLFLSNTSEIQQDFRRITQGRKSEPITDPFTRVYSPENVFVEEGADIKAAIINAANGPVYIGKNAILQEGCLVIGPAAIGENSMVAFGAKIRPNVTLGPVCRVGGEVGNSIFMGYSNKAHDGFLGNSVIGE